MVVEHRIVVNLGRRISLILNRQVNRLLITVKVKEKESYPHLLSPQSPQVLCKKKMIFAYSTAGSVKNMHTVSKCTVILVEHVLSSFGFYGV